MNPNKLAHRAEPVGRFLRSAALRNVQSIGGLDTFVAAELNTVEDCDIANIVPRQIGIGLQLGTDGAFRVQSARYAL